MWSGTFDPKIAKHRLHTGSLANHITLRNVEHFDDIVQVTIEFTKSPGEQYTFDIPVEDYKYDKEVIAEQIVQQLRTKA